MFGMNMYVKHVRMFDRDTTVMPYVATVTRGDERM